MPIVRIVTNKAGTEGLVIGITPKDIAMLREHGMCQMDIRCYALGAGIMASCVLVMGETEEQILDMIDPHRLAIVVNENRLVLESPTSLFTPEAEAKLAKKN